MDIQNLIFEFIAKIKDNKIEIYNEAGIQHELAIFLRSRITDYTIQLEKNISYFELDKKEFEKKEIDIVLFNKDKKDKIAIEIKFPRNGQYPEQMFSFCKDIKFLEQLKHHGFQDNIFLALADDSNFWNNNGGEGTIYHKFRNLKLLSGQIVKPTGAKDKTIQLSNEYRIEWKELNDTTKFFVLKI